LTTPHEQFQVSQEFKDDMFRGWSQNNITSADAFYHYYSHFTRDQDYLESNLNKLKTPVKVIWGEKDFYIKKEMGVEFAKKTNIELIILSGLGHYPHLQSPKQTIEEIRASFGGAVLDRRHTYAAPVRMRLNHWAFRVIGP
jgi:pimeloyl-ACP methyl ester carboxylesterase